MGSKLFWVKAYGLNKDEAFKKAKMENRNTVGKKEYFIYKKCPSGKSAVEYAQYLIDNDQIGDKHSDAVICIVISEGKANTNKAKKNEVSLTDIKGLKWQTVYKIYDMYDNEKGKDTSKAKALKKAKEIAANENIRLYIQIEKEVVNRKNSTVAHIRPERIQTNEVCGEYLFLGYVLD